MHKKNGSRVGNTGNSIRVGRKLTLTVMDMLSDKLNFAA